MKIAAFILIPPAIPTRQEVAAAMSDMIAFGGAFKEIEASANDAENKNQSPTVAALAAGAHSIVFDMHECALASFKEGNELGLIDAAKFAEQGIDAAAHMIAAIGAAAPSFARDVLPTL